MATKKTTQTQEQTKKATLEQVFALWRRTSKAGKSYFTGKVTIGENGKQLRAFFNTDKKNPKEPDLLIYEYTDNKISKEEFCSMWCNATNNGKKYLTGKLGEKRIVGFIYNGDNEKAPYLSVYYSDDKQTSTNEKGNFEDVTKESKLPF